LTVSSITAPTSLLYLNGLPWWGFAESLRPLAPGSVAEVVNSSATPWPYLGYRVFRLEQILTNALAARLAVSTRG
jgi:hypothetical protein